MLLPHQDESPAPSGFARDVCDWHIGDIARSQIEVRFRRKSGHAAGITAMTGLTRTVMPTPHAALLDQSNVRMLRVIPLSGRFGIRRHGDNTFNRSPSSL